MYSKSEIPGWSNTDYRKASDDFCIQKSSILRASLSILAEYVYLSKGHLHLAFVWSKLVFKMETSICFHGGSNHEKTIYKTSTSTQLPSIYASRKLNETFLVVWEHCVCESLHVRAFQLWVILCRWTKLVFFFAFSCRWGLTILRSVVEQLYKT